MTNLPQCKLLSSPTIKNQTLLIIVANRIKRILVDSYMFNGAMFQMCLNLKTFFLALQAIECYSFGVAYKEGLYWVIIFNCFEQVLTTGEERSA